MTSHTETVNCPECDEEVQVTYEWEPGDPHYGADADGNRSISIPGYWWANDIMCPTGHTFAPGDPQVEADEPDFDDRDDDE